MGNQVHQSLDIQLDALDICFLIGGGWLPSLKDPDDQPPTFEDLLRIFG